MLNFKYALHGNAILSLHGRIVCLHCASVTFDSVTLLRTMLELTVELSKQKRKQAPTVNSSILLTLFQMNGYLHVAKRFEAVRKI